MKVFIENRINVKLEQTDVEALLAKKYLVADVEHRTPLKIKGLTDWQGARKAIALPVLSEQGDVIEYEIVIITMARYLGNKYDRHGKKVLEIAQAQRTPITEKTIEGSTLGCPVPCYKHPESWTGCASEEWMTEDDAQLLKNIIFVYTHSRVNDDQGRDANVLISRGWSPDYAKKFAYSRPTESRGAMGTYQSNRLFNKALCWALKDWFDGNLMESFKSELNALSDKLQLPKYSQYFTIIDPRYAAANGQIVPEMGKDFDREVESLDGMKFIMNNPVAKATALPDKIKTEAYVCMDALEAYHDPHYFIERFYKFKVVNAYTLAQHADAMTVLVFCEYVHPSGSSAHMARVARAPKMSGNALPKYEDLRLMPVAYWQLLPGVSFGAEESLWMYLSTGETGQKPDMSGPAEVLRRAFRQHARKYPQLR